VNGWTELRVGKGVQLSARGPVVSGSNYLCSVKKIKKQRGGAFSLKTWSVGLRDSSRGLGTRRGRRVSDRLKGEARSGLAAGKALHLVCVENEVRGPTKTHRGRCDGSCHCQRASHGAATQPTV